MKKTNFKVMVWLRAIREQRGVELKDKSPTERADYYRRQTQPLQSKFQSEPKTG